MQASGQGEDNAKKGGIVLDPLYFFTISEGAIQFNLGEEEGGEKKKRRGTIKVEGGVLPRRNENPSCKRWVKKIVKRGKGKCSLYSTRGKKVTFPGRTESSFLWESFFLGRGERAPRKGRKGRSPICPGH